MTSTKLEELIDSDKRIIATWEFELMSNRASLLEARKTAEALKEEIGKHKKNIAFLKKEAKVVLLSEWHATSGMIEYYSNLLLSNKNDEERFIVKIEQIKTDLKLISSRLKKNQEQLASTGKLHILRLQTP